ncbi:MFS transporter [Nocardiaceae bacterium NPDC056970]
MAEPDVKSLPRDLPPTAAAPSLNTGPMRRILLSSFLGSAIEFYDFILYSLAASIVFHQVFFAQLSTSLATLASFGTLAAGYVARPLGGMIFGRIGDRTGRKSVLVTSMAIMGAATVGIGLLPTYAQIGVTAPVLLIVLRIVQGLAVGGEFGGAMLVAAEHAPEKRRGFAASFANMGGPAGSLLAAAAMAAASALPDDQFYSWGWRVPFLLSFVLILIGLGIRLRISETPAFQALSESDKSASTPIKEVFTRYPRRVLLSIGAGLAGYACQGLLSVWAIGYAVSLGVDRSAVLEMKIVGALGMVFMIGYSATLGDRYGRRPVLIAGAVFGTLMAYPIVLALGSGSAAWTAAAIIFGQAVVQGIMFGPFSAFLADQFPTRVRYTGSSIGYQTASTFGAGFTPIICAWLLTAAGGSNVLVGAFFAGMFALSGLCAYLLRD